MEAAIGNRVIVLVDMDCFYVQVEQKLQPEYQNKPCAVVQYTGYKGGGIIAVNYEARAKGVPRHARAEEAQKKCPDIHLFRVPEIRGKADLTRYRDAGALVLDVLCEYSDCVERASIDEAYLDMTSVINSRIQTAPQVTADQLENTFVVGWEGDTPESRKEGLQKWLQMIYEEEHLFKDRMLALAAVIVEEMRTAVYEKTGYRCSAGIAHNKMLAKLSCGIHKPNKQTVLPESSISILFKTMPIKKVRNLGGKLGEAIMKKFNVENMGDLIDVPKSQLTSQLGEKTGHWLFNLVRGVDNEPVTSRQLPKSIGCGKNFPGKKSLSTKDDVIHWLKQLSTELEERLVKDQNVNQRVARLLTISVRTRENDVFSVVSRSCPIYIYNGLKLAQDALTAISKLNTSSSDSLWKPSIWTLSMAASKFEDKLDNTQCNIQSFFSPKSSNSADEIDNKDVAKSKSPEPVKNATLKSENSNKSIISFFTKKTLAGNESVAIAGTSSEENKVAGTSSEENKVAEMSSEENKVALDSSVSACIAPENCDMYTRTGNEFIDTSCSDGNSTVLPEKQNQPRGFFARKLKEKINPNTEQNNCDVNNESVNKINDETIGQTASTSEGSISLFDYENDEYSDLDPELTKVCDECSKRIPIWEETEHSDYHMALNLSKEFSSRPSSANTSIVIKSSKMDKNAPKSKNSRKRVNRAKCSSQSKKALTQSKTLDAFFK